VHWSQRYQARLSDPRYEEMILDFRRSLSAAQRALPQHMLAPGSSCSHCQWQRPGTPRRTGGGWAARGNAGMAALGTQGSRQELVLGPGLGADSAEMQPAARTVVCHRRSHLNASHMRPQPARDSQRPYARALMHEKHVTAMKKRRPSWYSSTEDYGRICTVEYCT
jgi:hypothetical protein